MLPQNNGDSMSISQKVEDWTAGGGSIHSPELTLHKDRSDTVLCRQAQSTQLGKGSAGMLWHVPSKQTGLSQHEGSEPGISQDSGSEWHHSNSSLQVLLHMVFVMQGSPVWLEQVDQFMAGLNTQVSAPLQNTRSSHQPPVRTYIFIYTYRNLTFDEIVCIQ